MSRLLAACVVFSTVLVSAAVAGLWTGRWGSSRALQDAVARLDEVPLTLGEAWDGQPEELSDQEVAVAEIDGYVRWRYVNRRTGAVVSMLLVCGRSGPVAAHTPDVCYAGVRSGRRPGLRGAGRHA
jgi:hypothetical protein